MNDLVREIKGILPDDISLNDITFVCIGTDRSTGDSLGPLVGTNLSQLGYDVIGTLHEPCHAVNLDEMIEKIPSEKIIIAIDASLGDYTNVGKVRFGKGPLKPGAGLQKELTPVGDYHVAGVVNVSGFMEYFVLQNTRLSLVIDMAARITDAITCVFPLALAEVAVSE